MSKSSKKDYQTGAKDNKITETNIQKIKENKNHLSEDRNNIKQEKTNIIENNDKLMNAKKNEEYKIVERREETKKLDKDQNIQKDIENDENKMIIEKKKKEIKTRKKIVLYVLAIALIIIYVIERGEYLEIKEIGEQYISMFWKNMGYIAITAIINFSTVYTIVYITTTRIKKGLKTFFDDEKKQMPKLPQKSIAFISAVLITIFTSGMILEKALPCFNNTQFVATDPVLGLDIGYFVFIWPFIELIVLYILVAIIASTIYAVIYYLIVFNIYFDGISRESVKRSKILDQTLTNLKILIIIFALFVLVETQNVGVQKFIVLNSDETSNYSLFGAGITETTIGLWGYGFLSIVMVASVFKAIKEFKNGETKKVIKSILIVPAYLVMILVLMIGFNLIFVNSNELDKEKKYISENIKNTKVAYGIDIDEITVQDEGTITQNVITDNMETINNIPIVNKQTVLKDLTGSKTNKGYYSFKNTQIGLYKVEGKEQLVYVTPREIASSKGTYNNKTYEYTHGFGTIITSATNTTNSGNINHIQKSFEQTDESLNIKEPRIYFGLETNDTVVTNSNSKKEFDYPTDNALNNAENIYDGDAGLEANFLDRLVLAIKEKDAKLLFSGNVKKDSKILTNRNIIQRAKTIMPYLIYDNNPYMIVTNDGEMLWILDAYTVTNNYPYSQRLMIEDSGISKKEINYIRNSVKVIINAYSGDVTFYITDKTDPIAIMYKNLYPELFSEEVIKEDISNHFVYPEFLYSIQAEILERYHNVQPDVLYRSDDIWNIATHNTSSKITSAKGIKVEPYYTMVKTVESNGSRLGLVLPYTLYGKQNIKAYLVGSCDENGNNILRLYNYPTDSNVLGPMQLDTQLAQDETISKEIDSISVTGTKLTKDIVIVPINNTLLYVEPIYQQYVNETDSLPVLKKVVVASGTKVAIGDTFSDALMNLVSQYAFNIEVSNTDNINELMTLIIKANNNLKTSTQSNDWEQIGKDTKKLQNLVDRLEELKIELDKKNADQEKENSILNIEIQLENIVE